MSDRINEGYIITDSIQVGETEFVFGKRFPGNQLEVVFY